MDKDAGTNSGAGGARFSEDPPLIEPGGVIGRVEELESYPTKKFRLKIDQGFGPQEAESLLVLYEGEVRAFVNWCPHIGTPLDWMPNEFFDAENKRLLCRTHGALFDPISGDCLGGPCDGKGLIAVNIDQDGEGNLRLPVARLSDQPD